MRRWIDCIRRLDRSWSIRSGPPHPLHARLRSQRQGFTLTELAVASLILSVVIFIAWTGLITALNMTQSAQARTARQAELAKALDVMTSEVRQAQAINRSGAVSVEDGVTSVAKVVENAGVNLDELGNYGEIALYLELPTTIQTATCETAGGYVVADPVDKVVYDVRPSFEGWLSPNVLVRHGRIPQADGSIDPCSTPVSNDIIADALTDQDNAPPCAGVITGDAGFHTCTQGDNVALLFDSAIEGLDTNTSQRYVTLRQAAFTPTPTDKTPSLVLSVAFEEPLASPKDRDWLRLTWSWNGKAVDARYQKLEEYKLKDSEPWPYQVHIQDDDKTLKMPVGDPDSPGGINMRYQLRKRPGNACFKVEGVTPEQEIVESNQVCVVAGQM